MSKLSSFSGRMAPGEHPTLLFFGMVTTLRPDIE